jgi:hypothetical protein
MGTGTGKHSGVPESRIEYNRYYFETQEVLYEIF